MPNVMIIPSTACPAGCRYCFGPNHSSGIMTREVLNQTAQWLKAFYGSHPPDIVFHGGEPLTAGKGFYREALPLISGMWHASKPQLSVQSNLWLMDDEYCEIFKKYNVSIGTSLDGPRAINDKQRGKGYFNNTLKGLKAVHRNGLNAGFICTFTNESIKKTKAVFQFFEKLSASLSIHGSVAPLNGCSNRWVLRPEAYGKLLLEALDQYPEFIGKMSLSTLDAMILSIKRREGHICTFSDCLGGYLAISPDGSIYPCQRFIGLKEYILGHVSSNPARDDICGSEAWTKLKELRKKMQANCDTCSHNDFCKGGCPYNALASGGGKDPYCEGFRKVFDTISLNLMNEFFSEENKEKVLDNPDGGLFKNGFLSTLSDTGKKAIRINHSARNVLTAWALGSCSDSKNAVLFLKQKGLVWPFLEEDAESMSKNLKACSPHLFKLYLHTTYHCNLRCAHCYAEAGKERDKEMSLENIERICLQSAGAGFSSIVITGGEPLFHSDTAAFLKLMADIKPKIGSTKRIIRTNLSLELTESLIQGLNNAFDRVVVSLDGNRETHDQRRGSGNYDRVLDNLKLLLSLTPARKVALAATLTVADTKGLPGRTARNTAHELGVALSFRPLLPLGRMSAAKGAPKLIPAPLRAHLNSDELLSEGWTPKKGCGMGQNLFIEPDLSVWPCYATLQESFSLGKISDTKSLDDIVNSDVFKCLGRHGVDSNDGCKACDLRYLCGGQCRAWLKASSVPLSYAPENCEQLKKRAEELLERAKEVIRAL